MNILNDPAPASQILRNYPLPAPIADPRFTAGLLFDVANVLQEAGYPELTDADLAELRQALRRVLYRPERTAGDDPQATPVNAPLPTRGVGARPAPGHPKWCDRQHCDDTAHCGRVTTIRSSSGVYAPVRVWLSQPRVPGAEPVVVVSGDRDGILSLRQGRALAHTVRRKVLTAGGPG